MASKSNGIDINTVLIIGGGILLYPIIKGMVSAANAVGDILSTPERFADAMNDQLDQDIHDAVYHYLISMAGKSNYDPNNGKDVFLMESIPMMTGLSAQEKFSIISLWKAFKADVFFNNLAEKTARQIANEIVNSWW